VREQPQQGACAISGAHTYLIRYIRDRRAQLYLPRLRAARCRRPEGLPALLRLEALPSVDPQRSSGMGALPGEFRPCPSLRWLQFAESDMVGAQHIGFFRKQLLLSGSSGRVAWCVSQQ
jgi:hypothetical protein